MKRTKNPTEPAFYISRSIQSCLDQEGVSIQAYQDLKPLMLLLDTQEQVASKSTHYQRLDEWSDVIMDYVHKMLDKYGFRNGGPVQPIDARFWWNVYYVATSPANSRNLISEVSSHHSSAWERNEVLRKEIFFLITKLCRD